MSKELIVSTSPHELRVAITEENQLVEIYIESESQHGLAGSIYKGRVTRVLPGMQSAFVNIGLSRDAFLYVSDFTEESEDLDHGPAADEAESKSRPVSAETSENAESSAEGEADDAGRSDRRDDRGRGRGRRGRRGRRRRGRSEGFPDAKYADVKQGPREEAAETKPVAPEVDPAPEAEETGWQRPRPSSRSFAVLPGESLAKYAGVEEVEADDPFEGADESHDELPDDESSGGYPAAARDIEWDSDDAGEQDSLPRSMETSEDAPDDGDDPLPARETSLGPGVLEFNAQPAGESGPESELAQGGSPGKTYQSRSAFEPRNDPEESEYAEDDYDEASVDTSASAGEESSTAAASEHEAADGESSRVPGRPEPAPEARVRGESGSARYSRRRGRRGRRRRGRREEDRTGQAAAPEARPIPAEHESADETFDEPAEPASPADANGEPSLPAQTSISDLLKKGQEILVQIAKEPLGRKGARITSHIALPGRFLVYMPTVEHVGVSRKIFSDRERGRLRRIVQTHRTGMPGGFIVRTAGENATEEDVHGDMLFLYNLWLDIRQKAERKQGPALIHQDLDVVQRVMRDQIGEDYKTIWVDGEDEYERILRFVERFQPALIGRVKLYTRSKPIFDEFDITQDLERALRPKVWLKSGGYIVINPTEALVSIDVNTGKFVGKSDRLEDTIVKTNLEAAAEIVRQMRLRDLGGIIVVDFIDMDDRKNRQKVLLALEEAMRADRAPSKVLSFNEFGLLAITRKRVKQSLERALCTPCPYCSGSGYVKSPQTVVYEILAEAKKMSGGERHKDVTLRVNPEVARLLKSKDNRYLQEVEDILHSNVLVRSDVGLNRESFDIN